MKKKIYSCMDDYDPNSILIEDALKKITKITKKIETTLGIKTKIIFVSKVDKISL